MIQFPIWLVGTIREKSKAPDDECGEPDVPLAFSTPHRMASYMMARKDGQWEVRLVTPRSAIPLLADLHDQGHSAICQDVEDDGSGGRKIALAELLAHLTA